jgi:hypothetical protein
MKGTGELVIYVDLDGVVHHEEVYAGRNGPYVCQDRAPGRTLFEWAHFLIEALEPYPDVKLVLSSSWCRRPGYSRTLKRLPEQLRHRFVGGTYHRGHHGADLWLEKSFADSPRGVQILADVLRRQPRDWFALDDDEFGWPAWPTSLRGHLLLCDSSLGLSKPETQTELRARLALMTAGAS